MNQVISHPHVAHQIVHCENQQQQQAVVTLLDGMYPEHSQDYVSKTTAAMLAEGWQQIAIFAENGDCDATIMYRIGERLFCGRYMQLESLYVNPKCRRGGQGRALFDWLEATARTQECQRILLESYVENFAGHQFFFKQGYFIRGYVVNKILE